MKVITYSKIGYNAPSQANWTYGIWKIDLIDDTKPYCMSYVVKENFGGECRLKNKVESLLNTQLIETKSVYPTQKITGIRSIDDMEGDKIFNIIKDFLNNN